MLPIQPIPEEVFNEIVGLLTRNEFEAALQLAKPYLTINDYVSLQGAWNKNEERLGELIINEETYDRRARLLTSNLLEKLSSRVKKVEDNEGESFPEEGNANNLPFFNLAFKKLRFHISSCRDLQIQSLRHLSLVNDGKVLKVHVYDQFGRLADEECAINLVDQSVGLLIASDAYDVFLNIVAPIPANEIGFSLSTNGCPHITFGAMDGIGNLSIVEDQAIGRSVLTFDSGNKFNLRYDSASQRLNVDLKGLDVSE